MAYEVRIRRSAEKEIADLQPVLQQRVIEHIRALATAPRPPGCKKLSGGDRAWRIRVGDYRVVYEINDSAHYIEVRSVAHRREIYRR